MFSSEQGELFTVDRDDKSDHCKVVSRFKVDIDDVVETVFTGDGIGDFADPNRSGDIVDILDDGLRNCGGSTVSIGDGDGEGSRSGFRGIGEGEDTIGESSGNHIAVDILGDDGVDIIAVTALSSDIEGEGVIAFALSDAVDGEADRIDHRVIVDGDGDTVFGGDIVLDTVDDDGIVNDRRTVDGDIADDRNTARVSEDHFFTGGHFNAVDGEVAGNGERTAYCEVVPVEGEVALCGNIAGEADGRIIRESSAGFSELESTAEFTADDNGAVTGDGDDTAVAVDLRS